MYETRLEYCARPDEETWFVTEGIDYRFCILLDGEPIAAQEGMFTPVKIDLTGRVHSGALLRIHIYPHPNRGGQWSSYHQVADQSCKPPATYALIDPSGREVYRGTEPNCIAAARAELRFPCRVAACVRTDVLEQPVNRPATVDGQTVRLTLGANEMATLRVQLQP